MKFKKILCVFCTFIIVISSVTIHAFASEDITNLKDSSTEISANVQGLDASSEKAIYSTADAIARVKTDIKDDNHAFSKDVEVWGVSKTWLEAYSSDTPDGIPDWTLMAMCQLWVSNGIPNYVTSPTASAYNQTKVTATTKKVKAKDGGNASATGYHTIKDYDKNIILDKKSTATEKF